MDVKRFPSCFGTPDGDGFFCCRFPGPLEFLFPYNCQTHNTQANVLLPHSVGAKHAIDIVIGILESLRGCSSGPPPEVSRLLPGWNRVLLKTGCSGERPA
jgi:hypothetical protein